uniref:Uncharacterized protein n=1 Tax=Panagrolaimus sp. PS1159 TaxID=55785 RepID=A0AC35FQ88_9BILA
MKYFIYFTLFSCFILAVAYGNSCNCDTDTPPTSDHNCQEQANTNKCGEPFMKGFCCKSCSPECTLKKTPSAGCSSCETDVPPTSDHICSQQASSDKCGEPFMKGFCCKSCCGKTAA